jgi:hypothetical protein
VCGLTGTKILTTTDEQPRTESSAADPRSRHETTLAPPDFTVPGWPSVDCVGINERNVHAFINREVSDRSSEGCELIGAGDQPLGEPLAPSRGIRESAPDEIRRQRPDDVVDERLAGARTEEEMGPFGGLSLKRVGL